MSPIQFYTFVFLLWQFCVAYSVPLDIYSFTLPPDVAERLAGWTEDDKQNIWELSGQFEGDMILTADQRNGLIDTNFRWNNKEIPYEIDPIFNDTQREWIDYSLTEYYNKTCIKPRLRNASDEDYVYITGANTGCHSFVGRMGGRQTLNLQPNEPGVGCLRLGTVVHEFLHALGFYHQQSATERDDYVEIVWDNIQSGKERNFIKYGGDNITSFDEEYDYNSVMHYSAYAFSKNGNMTIVPMDPQAQIGQRARLSEIDALKLNKMYECE